MLFVPALLNCNPAQNTEFRAPMSRVILIIITALGFTTLTQAQHELKFYQTLSAEAVQRLEINVAVQVTIIYWGADHIMVETSVEAPHSQRDIVKALAADGRYKMDLQELDGQVIFQSPRVGSRPVSTKNGTTIQEKVVLTVYLPDVYVKTGEYTYTRPLQDSIIASSF